ncbi:hypothetical protein KAW64_15435, partial [bacterium]|nr:hypothetical protein [bacterium]
MVDRKRAGGSAQGLALMAILTALAVALGMLLAHVPNIELVSFTVFVSGAVLGRWRGACLGMIAMGIYSGANPIGSGLGIPPMFIAQVLTMAFIGFVGGSLGGVWRTGGRLRQVALAAVTGFVLTGIYQVGVIAGLAVASLDVGTGFVAALVGNAFFSTVHIVSNTIVFAML